MNFSFRRLAFGILNRNLLLGVLIVSISSISFVAYGQEEEDEEFVQEGLVASKERKTNSDPVKLFLEGQRAHEGGDLDKALELYSEALRAFPEFPEAEYQRGTIYQKRGMWQEAESSFRKAVEFRRDWTLAMAHLGSVLIRNGKYDEAGIILDKAIRLDGMSFPAYTAVTDLYLLRRPGKDKIKHLYSNLVFLTTKSKVPGAIWACRGAIERVLGYLDDARKSIARSYELEPGNDRAQVEEIELALANSDFKAAIELASARVKRGSDDAGSKMLLARGVALGGDDAGAIAILESIAEQNEESRELLAVIRASGETDIPALEAKLRVSNDNVKVLGRLCSALRIDDPQKALGYCERAYRLERDNIRHAVGFGAALVQLRQFSRAVKLLEEIKRTVPDNHTVRANLATAYFKSEQFEKAKVEYKWITETQPELAAGYYFLAITHDNLREYLDAMANYQQFLRLADRKRFEAELDRVRLRMPLLQKQINKGKGKKRGGKND